MFFLYYIPDVEQSDVTPDILRRHQLGDVFRDSLGSDFADRITMRGCAVGPDGSSGSVVVALPTCEHRQRIGYYPDQQTWEQVTEGDQTYFIGTDNGQPPTPAGLARSAIVAGYEYELGDGQVWTCPVIRHPTGRSLLPASWGVDAAGEFTTHLLPEFESYWTLATHIWEIFIGERNAERPQIFEHCVQALSLNYRVGPHEVSRLDLLNSSNYVEVFKAAVDGRNIEEFAESEYGQDLLSQIEPPEESAATPA